MLLTMFYIVTYLTDSPAQAKVVELPGCHEFFLLPRLYMTLQTCKIAKLSVPYFHMWLNMFNEETYVKDGIERAKDVK